MPTKKRISKRGPTWAQKKREIVAAISALAKAQKDLAKAQAQLRKVLATAPGTSPAVDPP
jgi:translation initiation factor 1 (eIF-1/SUI1)